MMKMDAETEIWRLRSEILRLHKWIDRDSDDELLQENERLRAVLNRIADNGRDPGIADFARAALTKPPAE